MNRTKHNLHFRRSPRGRHVGVYHTLHIGPVIVSHGVNEPPERGQSHHPGQDDGIVIHRRHCGRQSVLGERKVSIRRTSEARLLYVLENSIEC